jgi:hypothetical protein
MSALLSSPTVTSRPVGKLYLRGPSQTIKGGPNVAVDTATPFAAHSLVSRDHYPGAIMRPEPTVGRRRWPETGGAALARRPRSREGWRILEQAAQHGHRVCQGLSIRVIQAGELWLDGTGAIGPNPVKGL